MHFFALAIKGGGIDPEDFGGVLEIVGILDHVTDVGLLDGLQRHLLAGKETSRVLAVVDGKIARINDITLTKDARTLDDVS